MGSGKAQWGAIMDARENCSTIGAPGPTRRNRGDVLIAAVFRSDHTTMDDILEIPSADVSKSQEREQDGEPDDGNSSADEEEGGLDWSKLPWVFQLYLRLALFESHARFAGSGRPPLGRSFRSGGKKSTNPPRGRIFKDTTSNARAVQCSMP